MDNVISDFRIIPKDNTECGIPRLCCDSPEKSSASTELNLAMATSFGDFILKIHIY